MKHYKVLLLIVVGLLIFGCGDRSPLDVLLDVDRIDATHFEVTDMAPAAWDKLKYWSESGVPPHPEELRVLQEAFYNRHVDADGISIVGNDATHDVHFINAAKCILFMTAKHPEVREAYRNYYYIIIAGGLGDFDRRRSSGAVLSETCPGGIISATCNEGLDFDQDGWYEDILAVPEMKYDTRGVSGTLRLVTVRNPDWTYPRAPLREYYGWTVQIAVNGRGESMETTTHEFTHALDAGFNQFIPNFRDKMRHAHINAIEKGLWPRLIEQYDDVGSDTIKFWTSETAEFWASIVTIWFYNIRPGFSFETPEEFIAYDPVVGALITECFVYMPFHELFSADYAVEKGYIAAPEPE